MRTRSRSAEVAAAFLIAFAAGASSQAAVAQDADPVAIEEPERAGPFLHDPTTPDLLFLDAPIAAGAAEALEGLLYAYPDVTTLLLDSSDGSMLEALAVADIIRHWQLDTIVTDGTVCADACFFAFAAGIGRIATGDLSLSFSVTPRDELFVASDQLRQLAIEELGQLGVDPDLVTLFETLGPGASHQLTEREIDSFGLNRLRDVGLAQQEELAPPTLLPTPTYNQDRTLGLPERGAFFAIDENGDVVDRAVTEASWRASSDPSAPSLLSTIAVGDTGLNITLALWPVATEQRPYVGELIVIAFTSADPDAKAVATIQTIAIAGEDDALQLVPFIEARYDLTDTETGFNNTFELGVPAAYAELVRAGYRNITGFIISLSYEDGTGADLILDMSLETSEAARALFEDWGTPPETEAVDATP